MRNVEIHINPVHTGPVKYVDKEGKDPDVLHIYGKVNTLVHVARQFRNYHVFRSGNQGKDFLILILKFLACWTCSPLYGATHLVNYYNAFKVRLR